MYEILCQVLANGLVSGARHGLVALGFGLVYTTCGFLPVSLSVSYIAAAYGTYALLLAARFPAAAALGIAVGVLASFAFEAGIFRRLSSRRAPPEACLIAALGLGVVGTAATALVFGRDTLVYDLPGVRNAMAVGPVILTVAQVSTLGACALCIAGIIRFMRTKHGLFLRAAGESSELALAFGMNLLRTRVLAATVGGSLVGLAGILDALDTDMRPMMGFQALLYGLVAAVVAGREGPLGYVTAGLLVGILQHTGAWVLPAQWQDGVVFLVLFLTLVLRPQGLTGRGSAT